MIGQKGANMAIARWEDGKIRECRTLRFVGLVSLRFVAVDER